MSAQDHQLLHPKYRPDIDGLRAIAVLSVVGFHAFGVKGGYAGVDIFFVISGFLISTIIFQSLDASSFSFVEFYQRRIRRIFPSLLLVLSACLIFGWLALFADEYQELGKHVVAGASFISNLILWGESGYFDLAAEKKPLLHLWSLGIEEQFYIFWPLVIWILWRHRNHFLWVIAAIGCISFGLNLWIVGFDSVAAFYSPLTRFWELLIGSIVAYLLLFKKESIEVIRKFSNTYSLIGLLLVALSIAFLSKDLAFPGWWALIPVSGAALLICAAPGSVVGEKVLSNPILVWFGLISFPLYLWHWPLLAFVRVLSGHSRWLINSAVVLAIFLAWLSYRYIERPIRQNRKLKSIFLISGMLCVALLAFAIYSFGGIPSRINDGQGGELANQYRSQLEWPESLNRNSECIEKYGADQYCLVGDSNLPPTAALIGDSHANHFYIGLNEHVKKSGGNLILLGAGGCPPFFEMDRVTKPPAPNLNCYQRNARPFKFVMDSPHIKTVFLAFRHNLTLEDDFIFRDRLGEIQSVDNRQNTIDALTRTIKTLESRGKRVVLIYDMPELNFDIKRCALKRPHFSSQTTCALNQVEAISDFDGYNYVIGAVERSTNVKIFDTRPYVKNNFPVDGRGNLNYRDSTHLSQHGSMFFADKYGQVGQ